MRIDEFITSLRKNNQIIISVHEDELKIKAAQGALTQDIIERIRERKTEILDFYKSINADGKTFSIHPATQNPWYHLSSAQKRLYFLYEFDKTSLAYNMPHLVKLEGDLDNDTLENTFNKLLTRHESLRTSFELLNGQPVQRISETASLEMEYFCSTTDGVDNIIRKFIRPFDLSKAPLIRAGVIETSPSEYILMMDMHHIIMDGVSQGVLIKDFMALYKNEALPELKLHYKDYAEWQLKEQQQQEITRQKKFWINEFSGELSLLELPFDFSRPLAKNDAGDSFQFEIGINETQKLKSIADEGKATMFMMVLSIYTILLRQLSNQEDIVVATPVAGRQHADLENIIGLFVNILPLRNYPLGRLSFTEFLQEVKTKTLSCFDHQAYPYEALIDELKVVRNASRNPLFDVMFVWQNFEVSTLELPGLTLRPYNEGYATSKFDVTLYAFESGGRIFLDFEYSTGLFEKKTIERFVSYFGKIVSSVITNADVRISDIEIVSDEERHQLIKVFNDTDVEFQYETVIEWFEQQVKKTPENIALRDSGNVLSYAELNEKSDKIALYLQQEAHVQAGDLVGVILEREVYLVASIFGILKACAAYIPIDPKYPAERINSIIEDSGLKVLLTRTRYLDASKQMKPLVIDLDTSLDAIEALPSRQPKVKITPAHLAYVIYTSGSTGKPKGVMIEHRSVTNIIADLQRRYPLNANDSYLLKTTYCFDVSVAEIFGWFSHGGSLTLLPPGAEVEPITILDTIERNGVTHINFVPSMFSVFVEELERNGISKIKTLRYIFLAGEALPIELVRRFNALNTSIFLENIYGPTEGTIYSCGYSLHDSNDNLRVPIGKPLSNIRLYIHGKGNILQPVGVPGELCIGGVGVARGYLNNEILTGEKFIDDPFLGDRIYKTGDLVRWLPDGNIEYLGRIDHQVKIRGYRIELGEIESQLLQHAGIEEGVVLAKEKEGDKYLVSYYVSSQGVEDWELKSFLSSRLPEYMVPAYFVKLAALPLTGNGKLDRRALPEALIHSGDVYVAPRSKEEKLLAEVWSKVLGIEKIGIGDNFFSVGGDSIKSIQISSRMRSSGYEVGVKDIFTHQTIQSLSGKLQALERVSDQSLVLGKVILSPIQRWFFEGPIKDKNHFNQSVLLNFTGGISWEVLHSMVMHLQEHHDALRMVFRKEEELVGENKGVELPVCVEVFDLTDSLDAEGDLLMLANQLQSGIALETGPLMKVGLFQMKEGSRVLLVIHHLVVDGISWRILFEDLEILYGQILKGEPVSLPAKTDSYQRWSSYLMDYSKSAMFEKAKGYWRSLSYRDVECIERDNEKGSHRVEEEKSELFELEKEETKKLLRQIHTRFHTQINDILLTGLVISLHKQYGHDRVVIDLEGHGREGLGGGINVSRTIGWFTCIYPVVLENRGTELSETIKHIKETLRGIPHHGLDYLLQKYFGSMGLENQERSRQICFNYLGQFDSDTRGASYRIAAEGKGNEVSLAEEREYDWDISGMILGDRLEMKLVYSGAQYEDETVRSFMQSYKESLLEIIRYCSEYDRVELTPSDLTYKGLAVRQLDELQRHYEIEDVYPLSPMQEGMLFHALLDSDSGNYFGQTTCVLKGSLNMQAIEQSMNELMSRYDVLRTIFLHEGYERSLQVVLKERKINFTYQDLREACLSGSKEEAIELYQRKDRSMKFNLSKDVLMRLSVLQTAEEEYVMIWSHHHIVMDGWCIGIIVNEFRKIYWKITAGHEISLSPPTRYSQYIEWLEDRQKETSAKYWSQYLESYSSLATIPQRSQTEVLPYLQEFHQIILDKEQTKLLQKISRQYGVTLNTILQCAWAIVLSRYNNVQDVVFGSVVSGRPAEIKGIESMVGLFINTIPVRVKLSPEDTIGVLLRCVQSLAMESEPHHYHPLSEIQTLSELGRGLLDHIIVFENFPLAEQITNADMQGNASVKLFEIQNVNHLVQTNYDFTLKVSVSNELEICFAYNANKYERGIVESIGSNLKNILQAITHRSDVAVKDISIFSDFELTRLKETLSSDLEENIRIETIQQKINKSFKVHDKNWAIEYQGRSFTYAEVGRHADKIAIALATHHVPEGSYIGVLCEDRYWLICSLLGILKSRAAFVPLETTLPQSRLSSMINQVACRYIITDQHNANTGFDTINQNITWLAIDAISTLDEIPFQNKNNCALDDLAYVYFTSGSTGVPKGVIGNNRGLSHFIEWEITTFGIDKSSRFSQFTNPGFDVFMRDIFVPLCAGGTICIPDENILSSPQALTHWIDTQRINLIHCVPSLFRLFTKHGLNKNIFYNLKYVLLAGEKILPYELKDWYKTFNDRTQLVNIYGPTETTLAKGYYLIDPLDSRKNYVPIKPIAGGQFLVLDPYLNICPKKAIGEIYIRTPYRTSGYLNSEDANRKSFIVNPFSSNKNDLLYKTGDLGRLHDDEEVEILGRIDQQVKVRGIRVELDDIKKNILAYPGITEAIAVVREDSESEKFICAYIVSEKQIDQRELRRYLSTVLPGNMVPSYLISIPDLPLMPNGKINRKALPEPDIIVDSDYAAPSNDFERKLVAIWATVLKIDPQVISTKRSFFELGGHSVRALSLIYNIQQKFSVKLSLREIFQNSSIKELAKLILSLGISSTQIPSAGKREYHPASPAQERMYYQHLLYRENVVSNISIPVRIKGEPDIERITQTFKTLIHRHEGLRTSFILNDDGVIQKINKDVNFELEILAPAKYSNVENAFKDFIRPFDLSVAPLMRCALFTHEMHGNLLFIDIHHIVCDGASLNILIDEFNRIYQGQKLVPLDLTYADYACWINEAKGKLQKQKEFWIQKLSGELPRLNLPANQRWEDVDTHASSVKILKIKGEDYQKIKSFTAKFQASDFMFLLSVYYVLLSKISQSSDIIIGTDAIGRTQPALKNIVGTFVNILPLRVEVRNHDSYIELLNDVKECVLDAFDNQDFQFDQMVLLVSQEEKMAQNPIVDVHFSFSNIVERYDEISDFEPFAVESRRDEVSEYEFKLEVREANDEMDIAFIYNTALYEDETIELLMSYYFNILLTVLENNSIHIERIELEALTVDQQ